MSADPQSPPRHFPFEVEWMEKVLGVRMHSLGRPSLVPGFTEIATDSRKISPGSLFVALKGERFDGHDFALDALRSGAAGVLVSEDFWRNLKVSPPSAPPDLPTGRVFAVPSVEESFTALAAAWRTRSASPCPIIAVGGSVGKTTTKELLAAILQGRFAEEVLKTEGSQNGMLGIPTTLLRLRPGQHRVGVIEIGIDEPGTMKGHVRTVTPTVALLTAIAPEHLEKLKDLETVAREELILLEQTLALTDSATVILNLDDSFIATFASRLPAALRARAVGVQLGTSSSSSLPPRFVGVEVQNGEESHLEIREDGHSTTRLPLPLPGEHHARNLLIAAGTARILGLEWDEIRRGLGLFRGAFGRTEVKALGDGSLAICDYYNANPASVGAGLSVLAALSSRKDQGNRLKTERWACLGDMLELGPEEERFHRDLVKPLLAAEVSHVLLFGPRMRGLLDELQKHASREGEGLQVKHFEDRSALGRHLAKHAEPGSVILIKGSRGMKMEEAWKIACSERSAWSKGV
jgi:UDP-N-acetylmuramoyl-tripeptide--D-alanyl-D-alanine ligase